MATTYHFNCKSCGELKGRGEFYPDSRLTLGHVSKCKCCVKKAVAANYRKNIDYYRAYDKSRSMLKHRIEARSAYAKTDVGKQVMSTARKKWSESNPKKIKAKMILNNAVSRGGIIKPSFCEKCSSEPAVLHGHHDDYSKPLSVRWLCPSCHVRWHKVNGEGKNG